MMNEQFMRSEIEYRRQQRLAAAAEHRRARSAVRRADARGRVGAALAGLFTARRGQHRAAQHGAARAA